MIASSFSASRLTPLRASAVAALEAIAPELEGPADRGLGENGPAAEADAPRLTGASANKAAFQCLLGCCLLVSTAATTPSSAVPASWCPPCTPAGSVTKFLQLSPSASFKNRAQVSAETGRGQATSTLFLETFSTTRGWFGLPDTLALWMLAAALNSVTAQAGFLRPLR